MRPRKLLTTIAIVAILLLAVAIAGLYKILAASPLSLLDGGVETVPQAAQFVSRRAPLMVSLLTNPERINSLAALNTPLSQRRYSQAQLIGFEQKLLGSTRLNYQTDIKPWLGEEITYAITSTDYDHNQSNGLQPGYLLVAEAKYPRRAKDFLQKAYSRLALAADRELVYQKYQGVNLIYPSPTDATQSTTTTAIIGRYVLFANHPRVLKEAINNLQAASLNLEQTDYYQQAIATIDQPRIAIIYANLPAVSALLSQQPETDPEAQTLTVALRLKPEGLVAQTAITASTDLPSTTGKFTEPVETLAYLPPQSILAIAGSDLKQLWSKIDTYLTDNTPLAVIANQTIANLEARLGLSLTQNIFSWVTGKYGLALFPNFSNDGLNWLFLAETDENAADAIMQLDQLAMGQSLSVGNFEIDNQTVTAWTKLAPAADQKNISLKAQVLGAHTEIDGYMAIANSVEAIASAMQKSANNSELEKAIELLPLPNDGYVYLNWSQGRDWFRQQAWIRVVELLAQPLSEHLQALTIAGEGTTEGVPKATMFLDLY